ncbi:IS21-like element helper ATPase IstB [Bacillota bacterium]
MKIKEMATVLKLSYIREYHNLLIDEATHLALGYEDFLSMTLERELLKRKENGVHRRIRDARFSVKKYLEDFEKEKYEPEIRNKFSELETMRFIRNKENIILIGTPGSGKTHYGTALGIKACIEGEKVLFVSIPNLVIELKEAMSLNQITSYKKKFEKYDLVILDELGYISFDKEGCEILFNLLSNRNDKGSIIITTNLTFDRWDEVFKDTMLTGAIVDRLAHKSHILDMSRDSYRLEETVNWLQETPKVATDQ